MLYPLRIYTNAPGCTVLKPWAHRTWKQLKKCIVGRPGHLLSCLIIFFYRLKTKMLVLFTIFTWSQIPKKGMLFCLPVEHSSGTVRPERIFWRVILFALKPKKLGRNRTRIGLQKQLTSWAVNWQSRGDLSKWRNSTIATTKTTTTQS